MNTSLRLDVCPSKLQNWYVVVLVVVCVMGLHAFQYFICDQNYGDKDLQTHSNRTYKYENKAWPDVLSSTPRLRINLGLEYCN